MNNLERKPCIVILGAGFGGLHAAQALSKKIKSSGINCDFFLIDRNGYHTYTPLLYEAATTSKETANYLEIKKLVAYSIPGFIDRRINFLQKEVRSLDLVGGDIHFNDGEKMKFDYLVLAPGSETNYFNIPGMAEYSLPLKTFLDSLKIRDKILDLVDSGKSDIKIVIGGAGSSGVELAGEIQEWICKLKEEGRKCEAKVSLIEGAPTILPGFPEKIVKLAEKRLKKLGVETITNEIIEKADTSKIILKSRREIPFDVLIWTGGVKAASILSTMPLKLEKRGRAEVIGEMECLPQSPDLKLYGKIYGIGDAICFYDEKSGKPMPGVARAAISQANIVANNIIEHIKKSKNSNYQLQITNYRPHEYPYIIPIGGKWAIAKLGPIVFAGFLGWILKGLVELNYLLSIMPFWKAIQLWLRGLWTFIKNDRLG